MFGNLLKVSWWACRLKKERRGIIKEFFSDRRLVVTKGFTTSCILQSKNKKDKTKEKGSLIGIIVSALFAITIPLYLNKNEISYCQDRDDDDELKSRNSRLLSRNFVSDAIDCVSPAVVNLICPINGYLGTNASSGSGFIISKDGFIVTNAHVVNSASANGTEVIVTMRNGKKRSARVHSLDATSDIALVKISEDQLNDDLPIVTFGNSSKIKSGEFVVAIGSPMFLQNSASLGIVSATARHASELGISNNRSEYIQTDAAINVGNSGGPLVNLDGEVIGINTMKVKGTDGISFAIPIDVASQIIKQLRVNKRVIRPYVGLKMANFIEGGDGKSKASNKKRNAPIGIFSTEETKVIVLDIIKGSPAHRAGIQSGDLIMEVNGKEVTNVRDVLDAIGLEVGRSLDLKIKRQSYGELTLNMITAPEIER